MAAHTVSSSQSSQPLQLLQPYPLSNQPAIMSQAPQPTEPPQPQPQLQPQQTLQPKEKKARKSKKLKQQEQSPFNIHTFTLGMLPLSDISRYPVYCRKDDKEKPSNPIVRARRIFDTGKEVLQSQYCTRCLEHGQICIRGAGFSKCCYCTAEDLHPKEMCHLPGVADPPEENLSMTALSKKRKMDARTEAVTATTTFESAYGQSHFQVSTPTKRVRVLNEYPVSKPENAMPLETKIQDMSTALKSAPEKFTPRSASTSAGPEIDSTLVKAILERVTALEDRVLSLEKLQVKPDANGGSVSEIIATTPLPTTPSAVLGHNILRVHDKDGNLIQGSADVQMADNVKEN